MFQGTLVVYSSGMLVSDTIVYLKKTVSDTKCKVSDTHAFCRWLWYVPAVRRRGYNGCGTRSIAYKAEGVP
jgi:hypothetical protein